MLLTVQGTYENGTVRLDEPVAPDMQGQVLVIFLPETSAATSQESSAAVLNKVARLPKAAGPKQPRFSFDEALALPVKTHHSVSDAVAQEREEESNW